MWDSVIGEYLALSPSRGRVAFLSGLERERTPRPAHYLEIGRLEIWELTKKSGKTTDVVAIDSYLSWFPDCKRLAYVAMVTNAQANLNSGELGAFGKSYRAWKNVPVVHIVDLETGKKTALHVGWRPLVSSDGKSILVHDEHGQKRIVDADTGKSRAVQWPGSDGRAIAFLQNKYVLFWSWPTKGSPVRYTDRGSRGPRQMLSLKVADVETGQFQTVVPHLHPRAEVSFGKIGANR